MKLNRRWSNAPFQARLRQEPEKALKKLKINSEKFEKRPKNYRTLKKSEKAEYYERTSKILENNFNFEKNQVFQNSIQIGIFGGAKLQGNPGKIVRVNRQNKICVIPTVLFPFRCRPQIYWRNFGNLNFLITPSDYNNYPEATKWPDSIKFQLERISCTMSESCTFLIKYTQSHSFSSILEPNERPFHRISIGSYGLDCIPTKF